MERKRNGRAGLRRGILLPVLVGVPLILVLAYIAFATEPEALSPDEVLAKEEWSQRELQDALARFLSPAMTAGRRPEIIRHLGLQLRKLPEAEQTRIRQAAVVEAVGAHLRQLRKMPDAERRSIVETIRDKAERQYDALENDPAAREALARQMRSPEFEAFSREVNRVVFAELTPEERVQYAPLTKIWIRTLHAMGR